MGVTISGMTGAGSIRHNNRSFSAANVDRSRTEQNIVFCNEDLKQVYHMVFDEALAAYNAKKTKTRDKIPDYYEHIRQSKQEKLFHEAIFQIGNMSDCGCGTPDGERAAAALKDSAESFAERNPHPVSYTHLDVYKRQTPICGCSIWCCTWTRQRPISMSILSPVSYTHLDVYKRQFYPCGNGAVKRTFYKGIYETGIEAAGVCRCRQKADRMGGVDGTGERSSDGDRPAERF